MSDGNWVNHDTRTVHESEACGRFNGEWTHPAEAVEMVDSSDYRFCRKCHSLANVEPSKRPAQRMTREEIAEARHKVFKEGRDQMQWGYHQLGYPIQTGVYEYGPDNEADLEKLLNHVRAATQIGLGWRAGLIEKHEQDATDPNASFVDVEIRLEVFPYPASYVFDLDDYQHPEPFLWGLGDEDEEE